VSPLDELEAVLKEKLGEANEALLKGMPQSFDEYRFMVGSRAGLEHALVELTDMRQRLAESEE
jgi:hypothetical protein